MPCKNGLVEYSRCLFCQLLPPLPPTDSVNLGLVDHARLGERVQNTATRLEMHVRCREHSAPGRPLGSLGALVGGELNQHGLYLGFSLLWNPDF